jgi:hypothetical protein
VGVQVPLSAPFSTSYGHPLIGCRTSIRVPGAFWLGTGARISNNFQFFDALVLVPCSRLCRVMRSVAAEQRRLIPTDHRDSREAARTFFRCSLATCCGTHDFSARRSDGACPHGHEHWLLSRDETLPAPEPTD